MKYLSDAEAYAIHKRYAQNEKLLKVVYEHCKIVADIALWCAKQTNEDIDTELLRTACLVHDIGSYSFMHDSFDLKTYRQHALLGSKLAELEGLDPVVVDAIETHVLMGLTEKDIANSQLPFPQVNLEPRDIYGRLLCYADRFHSKRPVFNSYDFFVENHDEFPDQVEKFKKEVDQFGLPDLETLSKKYGHPIR